MAQKKMRVRGARSKYYTDKVIDYFSRDNRSKYQKAGLVVRAVYGGAFGLAATALLVDIVRTRGATYKPPLGTGNLQPGMIGLFGTASVAILNSVHQDIETRWTPQKGYRGK